MLFLQWCEWNLSTQTGEMISLKSWHVVQTPGFLLFALLVSHHEVNVSGVCKLKPLGLQKNMQIVAYLYSVVNALICLL